MFGLGLLPQGEVGLVLLLANACQLATLVLDVLQRATAQNAVAFAFLASGLLPLVISLDVEIDAAVALVSQTIIENLLHQLLLFDDMSCGTGLNGGAQTTHGIHCLMVATGIVLGNLHGFQLLQAGLLGNLVFTLVGVVLQVTHVRNVADIAYLVA